ncbi:hypothetical protein NG796_21780 [Laspinema sp. A4]|uniref:hypothetical protein n=1 Tax=Laspinema sp. D2d TaxID=2953686 RepID=UPI0021BBAD0B|nr:hypothetical protein [Laspinema sp. D2d]MCT7985911.1 hypothetical protein [Laspinema sp. D2d]
MPHQKSRSLQAHPVSLAIRETCVGSRSPRVLNPERVPGDRLRHGQGKVPV